MKIFFIVEIIHIFAFLSIYSFEMFLIKLSGHVLLFVTTFLVSKNLDTTISTKVTRYTD